MMNQEQPVSIIITNYNYGRYLREAIDSALGQDYHPIEVIIVDDGSQDDSRRVITSYGERIKAVLKENGGQASAFNAGFAASRGEVVIFLDADDVLLPHIAGRVAAVFQADPEIAKVQYRLAVIDAAGKPTGMVKPSWSRQMPNGDLRAQTLAFPDDILWQPTSGNAFAARVLRQILPAPEDAYRVCADYYLSNLPPLFGRILSLDEVGGYYRVHGANNHHRDDFNIEQSRQIITRSCHTHRHIKTAAEALGMAGPEEVLSVTFLAHRLLSLKMEPHCHPLQDDKLLSLAIRGVRASRGRYDLPWYARSLYGAWFISVLFAPRPMVSWLARKIFYPETRGKFEQLTRLLQKSG